MMRLVLAWLNQNVENMFNCFMADKGPSYKQLLFIHKWFNPDQNMDRKYQNPIHVKTISIDKFRIALFNYTEAKLLKHRNSIRLR